MDLHFQIREPLPSSVFTREWETHLSSCLNVWREFQTSSSRSEEEAISSAVDALVAFERLLRLGQLQSRWNKQLNNNPSSPSSSTLLPSFLQVMQETTLSRLPPRLQHRFIFLVNQLILLLIISGGSSSSCLDASYWKQLQSSAQHWNEGTSSSKTSPPSFLSFDLQLEVSFCLALCSIGLKSGHSVLAREWSLLVGSIESPNSNTLAHPQFIRAQGMLQKTWKFLSKKHSEWFSTGVLLRLLGVWSLTEVKALVLFRKVVESQQNKVWQIAVMGSIILGEVMLKSLDETIRLMALGTTRPSSATTASASPSTSPSSTSIPDPPNASVLQHAVFRGFSVTRFIPFHNWWVRAKAYEILTVYIGITETVAGGVSIEAESQLHLDDFQQATLDLVKNSLQQRSLQEVRDSSEVLVALQDQQTLLHIRDKLGVFDPALPIEFVVTVPMETIKTRAERFDMLKLFLRRQHNDYQEEITELCRSCFLESNDGSVKLLAQVDQFLFLLWGLNFQDASSSLDSLRLSLSSVQHGSLLLAKPLLEMIGSASLLDENGVKPEDWVNFRTPLMLLLSSCCSLRRPVSLSVASASPKQSPKDNPILKMLLPLFPLMRNNEPALSGLVSQTLKGASDREDALSTVKWMLETMTDPYDPTQNTAVISAARRIPELRDWQFLPQYFDHRDETAVKVLSEMWRIPSNLCMAVLPYGHATNPDYRTFISSLLRNPRLAKDEEFMLTVAKVVSCSYTNNKQALYQVTMLENLMEKYNKDFKILITTLLNTVKPRDASQAKHVVVALQLLLDIDDLDETILAKEPGFSIINEACEILSKDVKSWDDRLRVLKMRTFALKFPEKPIDQVRTEFQKQEYPMSPEELEEVIQLYEEMRLIFLDEKVHSLNEETKIVEALSKVRQRVRDTTVALARSPNSSSAIQEERRTKLHAFALIRQAVFLCKGYYPYNTQMMVVLGLLNGKLKGRLAQVRTGQGKSIIVSMLASFLAMKGHLIDIVTTSDLLAMRDAREMQHFFGLFGFTTGHCCDDMKTHEKCFKPTIVYGTPFHFEWAALDDEYDQQEVRHPRPYDVVIIDEVDSMLIDKSSHCTKIIYPSPIFHRVMWTYKELHELATEIQKTKSSLDKKEKRKLLADMVVKSNSYQKSSPFIREFIDENLQYWTRSAVSSTTKTEGIEYVVFKGGVRPVDYEHTGEVQANTFYISALHQILETREGLYPSLGHLSGCQMSHITFFNRFKQIYGLTGTMGQEVERAELGRYYELDTFDVPVHVEGQRTSMATVLCTGRDSWLHNIADDCIAQAASGRPVLVLCKGIRDTLALQVVVQLGIGTKSEKMSVQLLNGVQSEDSETIIEQAGRSGMITLATNLAGRGADIRTTKESEANGGMHVVITFAPLNNRVRIQAEGRTARQGKQGTVRYIFEKKQDSIPSTCSTGEEADTFLSGQRIDKETRDSRYRQTITAPISAAKEEMVQWVCKRLQEWKKIDEYVMLGARNQWVRFYSELEQNSDRVEEKSNLKVDEYVEEINKKFKAISKRLDDSVKAGKAIKDPMTYVDRGDKRLGETKFKEALEDYKAAIKIDPSYTTAYISMANLHKEQKEDSLVTQRLQEALKCADLNLSICDYDVREWSVRAHILEQLGRTNEAKQSYDRIKLIISSKMKSVEHVDAILKMAQDLINQEAPSVAVELLLYCIKLFSESQEVNDLNHPSNASIKASVYLQLGKAYTQLKRHEEAIVALEVTKQAQPNNEALKTTFPWVYQQWAWHLKERKRFEEALSICEKAVILFPDYLSIYNVRACIFNDQNRFQMAVHEMEVLIEKAKKQGVKKDLSSVYVSNLALFYRRWAWQQKTMNNPQDGLRLVALSLEHDPKAAEAYNTRGCCHLLLRNFTTAKKDFEKALSMVDSSSSGAKIYRDNIKLTRR